MCLQLTDFGASRSLCTPKSLTVKNLGTVRYMPPEVLAAQGQTESSSGSSVSPLDHEIHRPNAPTLALASMLPPNDEILRSYNPHIELFCPCCGGQI